MAQLKPSPDIGRFADDQTMRPGKEISSPAWREKIDALIKCRDDLGVKERRQLAASLRRAANTLNNYADRLNGDV